MTLEDAAEDLVRRARAVGTSDTDDPGLARELARCPDTLAVYEAGRLLADVPAPRVVPDHIRPRPLKVAVASTFTADNVLGLIRVTLLAEGIDPTFHLCPFGQLDGELADPSSGLSAFEPDVTLALADSSAVLPQDWDPGDLDSLAAAVSDRLSLLLAAAAGFARRGGGTVVLHTIPLPAPDRLSVISYRSAATLGRIWREANIRLLKAGEVQDGLYALDLEAMLVDEPGPVRDEAQYQFGRLAWSAAVERAYAREAAIFCRTLTGQGRKLLALDLDGTLWGGVVGEDGPEGIELGSMYPGSCYVETQRRALALRRQGVLLAVCSKNDPEAVDGVLRRHPDMLLRREDFVAVLANWQTKDANLSQLATDLGLATSSFAFADDSSFECGSVRRSQPEVEVFHLAGDPADHALQLLTGGHFRQLAGTRTDEDRTALYRQRRVRWHFADGAGSREAYLGELGIRVDVREADAFALPRLVQLGLRTNQFTMTGQSHSETRTRQMAGSAQHRVLVTQVRDRFGDEGIVAGAWVSCEGSRWVVENLVMSCRVLTRGVEDALVQSIVDRAFAAGARGLQARFVATGRNHLASELYPRLGFTATDPMDDGTVRFDLDLGRRPSFTPDWITISTEEALPHE